MLIAIIETFFDTDAAIKEFPEMLRSSNSFPEPTATFLIVKQIQQGKDEHQYGICIEKDEWFNTKV